MGVCGQNIVVLLFYLKNNALLCTAKFGNNLFNNLKFIQLCQKFKKE